MRKIAKRDFELVLNLLLHLEDIEDVSIIESLTLDGYDDLLVRYHLNRMFEASLIDCESVTPKTTSTRLIKVYPFGLTWEGHEFLDAMRQKDVMENIKKRLGGKLVDVPFSILKGIALALAKDKLGL